MDQSTLTFCNKSVSYLIHCSSETGYPSSASAGGDTSIPTAGSKPFGTIFVPTSDGRTFEYAALTANEQCGGGSFGGPCSGEDGTYRAFYYTAHAEGIIVFHAFVKKTQQTPESEIELGRKRLKEILDA
jgi:hypothetical protein